MKENIYIIVALLVITSMIACKSTKSTSSLDSDDLKYSLKKGACFGQCPVYTLEINKNGYAVYTGTNFTDKLGKYDKTLSKDDLNKLNKAFKNSKFSEYPTEYKSLIPDLPMIRVGYHNGQEYRVVSGREDRPEELMQLQFLLEKIADSGDWNLLESQEVINNAKKPEVVIMYEEVIIEPNQGLQMAKWLESKKTLGVRLIKKIAPGLNYYLITYDQSIINPKDFLQLLSNDKDIKTAEFNKKTSRR